MKTPVAPVRGLAAVALCVLLAGCLFKPASVSTRRFVLTPIPTVESIGATPVALGLGRVQLPEYLLQDAMAIRRGEHEIEYLENALWAERLDHSFQRVLAANLSSQLGPDRLRLTSWRPGEVTLVARVTVDRLDVDTEGRGVLIAHWRIEAADSGAVLRSSSTSLSQTGPAPFANPASVATTLSDLTAQFSRLLAQTVRESATMAAAP